MSVGVLIWSQYTGWQDLMRAGVAADAAGYDDLWSWDHLVPIKGNPEGPIFESLMTLAGWSAVTNRVRLGLMVASNTFREPALLAKMVTALDHMSGGRAVLGIGGGWFEVEHRAFGFPFGSGDGERLQWLDEAADLIRGMLDGNTVDARGEFYAARGLRNDPAPLQPRIPLLVGGGGERRTLATVARYADLWNIAGDIEEVRHKVAVLERWCLEVGRDPAEIARTIGVGPLILRDEPRSGAAAVDAMRARNRGWDEEVPVYRVPELAARLAPYLSLGFRAFHFDLPAPFDTETLRRFVAEVRPALAAAAQETAR